ncbi:MAG: ATP-dependent protease ATPase subunit HslU [Myxococcota bacterium]
MTDRSFTPREIVSELDRYIVGQNKAKRAVAIALRNRWRRQQVAPELRDEIAPKNIIMIGATGVGKTEIARRLAKLARAPFVKVEASKFTEVGYVGRDVESMIRDLVETAIQLVRDEELERVRNRAADHAEERLVQLLADARAPAPAPQPEQQPSTPAQMFGPFMWGGGGQGGPSQPPSHDEQTLDEIRRQLRAGALDDETVELEVQESQNPFMTIFGAHGMEEMEVNLRDMLSQLPGFKGGRTKRRRLKVPEARTVLEEQEAQKLVDVDRVQREAVTRAEESGIVFLDEIDKVSGRQGTQGGPDVSREGVQRDLLPIVEGSTVSTKYGSVKTDHMLFIAAGAFHVTSVSDLIPELQGRFPIRVELDPLTREDFVRILTEPKNALTRQYEALLATEGIELEFTSDAIDAIARYAAEVNERSENIGARRLHTIIEALLDDISFTAPERSDKVLRLDAEQVQHQLDPILSDRDMARYIL